MRTTYVTPTGGVARPARLDPSLSCSVMQHIAADLLYADDNSADRDGMYVRVGGVIIYGDGKMSAS